MIFGCAAAPEHGNSSLEVLEPTPEIELPDKSAKMSVGVPDIFVNDIPPSLKGELSRPAYPSTALMAHAGGCVIYATVTIDTTGAVSEVTPSWRRLNIPNRYSDDFLAAVKETVRKWHFEPARHVYWKIMKDGDLSYIRTETVPAMIDVKFTFESNGRVR
jgi:outer membrane biosynthesis protein TonB